jgi:hypothetical protein
VLCVSVQLPLWVLTQRLALTDTESDIVHSAQLIPEIAKDETVQIINFCRTPQWYFPRVRDIWSLCCKL